MILYDLCNSGSWGDKSIILGEIAYTSLIEGKEVSIATSNWNNYPRPGYDNRKSGMYSGRPYLYDPSKEPVDFFQNLIVPSLNISKYYNETPMDHSQFESVCVAGGCMAGPYLDKKEVSTFDYKILPELLNENFIKVESELKKTKNIVLCATYDVDCIYEQISDRLKGIDMPEERFEEMYRSIEKIDQYCLENPSYRIILINKKAVGWTKTLKSNYFDFRDFESFGLNFSQMFYLSASNCFSTVGQTSSMQLWLNYQSNRRHILFTNIGEFYLRKLPYFSVNQELKDVSLLFNETI